MTFPLIQPHWKTRLSGLLLFHLVCTYSADVLSKNIWLQAAVRDILYQVSSEPPLGWLAAELPTSAGSEGLVGDVREAGPSPSPPHPPHGLN